MKTISRKFLSGLTVVAMVSTVALTSCKKSETTPIPEEVEQNIENAYYITGIVNSVDGALSGVTVSSGSISATTDSDGIYSLKMSTTATATVNFSKDGYISINATAVFTNTSAGSAVTLSQLLTAQAEYQTASADEDTQLIFDATEESDVVIDIPAGAIDEDTDISATYYTPTATTSTAEAIADVTTNGGETTVTSSIMAVDLQPSGTTFEVPITITVPGDYIEGAYHAKLIDNEWVKQSDVSYDSTTGSYSFEVSSFSQHSIVFESEVSVSDSENSTVVLTSDAVNNLGNADATSGTISYEQYVGWEISESASNTLTNFVAGVMGSTEGVSKISQSIDVAAAGDEKVSVVVYQQKTVTTFKLDSSSLSAITYGDVSVETESEYGDMWADHN